jgi:hypothetical protein
MSSEQQQKRKKATDEDVTPSPSSTKQETTEVVIDEPTFVLALTRENPDENGLYVQPLRTMNPTTLFVAACLYFGNPDQPDVLLQCLIGNIEPRDPFGHACVLEETMGSPPVIPEGDRELFERALRIKPEEAKKTVDKDFWAMCVLNNGWKQFVPSKNRLKVMYTTVYYMTLSDFV